jgi:hypothetical protein
MAMRVRQVALIGSALMAVAVPWAYVVWKVQHARPAVQSDGLQPTAVVWAGRVFPSEADLGRWLRSRGSSLEAWRAAHPGGAAVLGHRPAPAVARRPAQTAAHDPVAVRLLRLLVEVLVVLLIVALVGLALAPDRLFVWLRPAWTNGSVEVRVASFAVALSIGTGVLVAMLLG